MAEKSIGFDKLHRFNLWKEAGKSVEQANPLEKKMLEQHRLLREIIFVPYTSHKGVFNPLVLVEGTGQGIANIDYSERLAKEAVQSGKAKSGSVFIPTGAIGVTKESHLEKGVVGVNADILANMHLNISKNLGDEIIVENKSLNTPEQAKQLEKIMSEHKFSNAVLIMSPWHAPRFYMTMVKAMPNVDFYSSFFWRDANKIGGAQFDYGIARFQAPLLIAEVARMHKYISEGSGPCSVERLKEYVVDLEEKDGHDPSGKIKLFNQLEPLWNETHREVMDNVQKYTKYR